MGCDVGFKERIRNCRRCIYDGRCNRGVSSVPSCGDCKLCESDCPEEKCRGLNYEYPCYFEPHLGR